MSDRVLNMSLINQEGNKIRVKNNCSIIHLTIRNSTSLSQPFISILVNPFVPSAPFLFPRKHQKTVWFKLCLTLIDHLQKWLDTL